MYFSVYSDLEENIEDSVYFFKKSGNLDKVQIGVETNVVSRQNDNNSKRFHQLSSMRFNVRYFRFWDSVSREVIVSLTEDWAYGHDFKLFGFNLKDYFESL